MSIRKATLEEWFLIYQLDKIKKDHFHLPFFLTVDVTKIVNHFEDRGEKVPVTALLIKAVGLLAEEHSEVNRIVFRTFYGIRIFDPEYISVNLPIVLRVQDQNFLAATVLENVNRASLSEIKLEIKKALSQNLNDLKIGKYVYKKRNNFLNRMRLRAIHSLVNHFPKIYEHFLGGGIAVSSLMNHNDEQFDMSMMAYGPTAFTIASCNLKKKDGRHYLKVGIAYDHFAFSGEKAIEASRSLSHILAATENEIFQRLIS